MKYVFRYLEIFIAGIMCAAAFSGCNGSELPSNEATALHTKATEAINATEPINQGQSEYPLGFNPNNANGWGAYDDEAGWLSWMESRDLLITEADYAIGGFKLGMKFADASTNFPESTQDNKKVVDEYVTEKTVIFDSFVFVFLSLDGGEYTLSSVQVSDASQATPRGLRVGDAAETLFKLYGVPLHIYNHVWAFSDGNYELLYVTVVDNLVKYIKLQGVL